MDRVDDVAAAFLAALGPMDAMKLEKLVYYAQAWSAASGRGPLFSNAIEAWTAGPVVPELFNQHRGQYYVSRWQSGKAAELSSGGRAIVDWVVDRYGQFSGQELSAITHAETPWMAARGDLADDAWSKARITVESMAQYYGRQVLSPEQAVRHAVGNASLEGLSVSEDFEALLGQVARGDRDPDEAIAELVASLAAQA